MMEKKRVHFVPRSAERTACGIVVDDGFNSSTPLVFGDLALWESHHWLRGRCNRCVRSVLKAGESAPRPEAPR